MTNGELITILSHADAEKDFNVLGPADFEVFMSIEKIEIKDNGSVLIRLGKLPDDKYYELVGDGRLVA